MTEQPDEFEWITLNFVPVVGNYIKCQFSEGNLASIFVRDRSRMRRGKILFALEEITLIDNGVAIVKAIEATMRVSRYPEYYADIQAVWSNIQVNILDTE